MLAVAAVLAFASCVKSEDAVVKELAGDWYYETVGADTPVQVYVSFAKDMTFEFAVAPAEGEASTGMANPWQTADTPEAAAEGAGLDGFSVAEASVLSIGEVKVEECRYMDGLAEVRMPVGAVDMTIRKGRADVATDGDI